MQTLKPVWIMQAVRTAVAKQPEQCTAVLQSLNLFQFEHHPAMMQHRDHSQMTRFEHVKTTRHHVDKTWQTSFCLRTSRNSISPSSSAWQLGPEGVHVRWARAPQKARRSSELSALSFEWPKKIESCPFRSLSPWVHCIANQRPTPQRNHKEHLSID